MPLAQIHLEVIQADHLELIIQAHQILEPAEQ